VRCSSSNWARRRAAVRPLTQTQPPRHATKRSWAAGSCKHRRPQFSPPPLCHCLRPDRARPRLLAGWLWALRTPSCPAARRRRRGCPLQSVAQRLGLWRAWRRFKGRALLPSCHASVYLTSSVRSLSAWVRRGRPQISQLWTLNGLHLPSWQGPVHLRIPCDTPTGVSAYTLGSPRLCLKRKSGGARETSTWRWVYAPIRGDTPTGQSKTPAAPDCRGAGRAAGIHWTERCQFQSDKGVFRRGAEPDG